MAEAIAENLELSSHDYSVCFQSRLGKAVWIQPYASERIVQLAEEGKKRLLVFCPSFVCDCLETIFEIGEEYTHLFKEKGGEKMTLVRGLNNDPEWFDACKELVLAHNF
jgi:ferrochelatase